MILDIFIKYVQMKTVKGRIFSELFILGEICMYCWKKHFKRYINLEYWRNNKEEIIKTDFDFPLMFIYCFEHDFSGNEEKINQICDAYYQNPQKENEYYPILKLIEFTEKYHEFRNLIKPCALKYPNSVALIFSKPSSSWGLRGDPFYWIYLEELFVKSLIPMDVDYFEKIIKSKYIIISGGKNMGQRTYIKKFAHGGMSSGEVSGIWLDLMDLLKYRLIKLNNDYYLNHGEDSKIIESPEILIKTKNMSFDEILARYDKPLRFG